MWRIAALITSHSYCISTEPRSCSVPHPLLVAPSPSISFSSLLFAMPRGLDDPEIDWELTKRPCSECGEPMGELRVHKGSNKPQQREEGGRAGGRRARRRWRGVLLSRPVTACRATCRGQCRQQCRRHNFPALGTFSPRPHPGTSTRVPALCAGGTSRKTSKMGSNAEARSPAPSADQSRTKCLSASRARPSAPPSGRGATPRSPGRASSAPSSSCAHATMARASAPFARAASSPAASLAG
jgi:hypothetical protein